MGDQLAGHMFNHSDRPDGRGNQSSMARFTFAGPTAPGGRWTVRKAESPNSPMSTTVSGS